MTDWACGFAIAVGTGRLVFSFFSTCLVWRLVRPGGGECFFEKIDLSIQRLTDGRSRVGRRRGPEFPNAFARRLGILGNSLATACALRRATEHGAAFRAQASLEEQPLAKQEQKGSAKATPKSKAKAKAKAKGKAQETGQGSAEAASSSQGPAVGDKRPAESGGKGQGKNKKKTT